MNTFAHTCTHCAKVDKIPRAWVFHCAACVAQPGEACVDLRTIHTTRKTVGYMHAERQALLEVVDEVRFKDTLGDRVQGNRQVQAYWLVAHVCTRCGQGDSIPRATAFFCSDCKARPGEACVSLSTTYGAREPMRMIHVVRQALVRPVDRVSAPTAQTASVG